MFPNYVPLASAVLGVFGVAVMEWGSHNVRSFRSRNAWTLAGLACIGTGVFMTGLWAYFQY
jgi:hypothetical protein